MEWVSFADLSITDFKATLATEMYSPSQCRNGRSRLGIIGSNTLLINMVSFCDIMLRKKTHIELQDDEDDEDSDDEGGDDAMKKRNDAPHVIKNDTEFGWPLIPKRGDMTLDQLKRVIRAYVTATYRE